MKANTKAQLKYMGLAIVIASLATAFTIVIYYQKASIAKTVESEEYLFAQQQEADAMQKEYRLALKDAVRSAIEEEYGAYPLRTCPFRINESNFKSAIVQKYGWIVYYVEQKPHGMRTYMGQELPSLEPDDIELGIEIERITVTFSPDDSIEWDFSTSNKERYIEKSSKWEVVTAYYGERKPDYIIVPGSLELDARLSREYLSEHYPGEESRIDNNGFIEISGVGGEREILMIPNGTEIMAEVQIKNIGCDITPDGYDKFYENETNFKIMGKNYRKGVCTGNLDGMIPGESYTATLFDWDEAAYVGIMNKLGNSKRAVVEVDPENFVVELDENNNVYEDSTEMNVFPERPVPTLAATRIVGAEVTLEITGELGEGDEAYFMWDFGDRWWCCNVPNSGDYHRRNSPCSAPYTENVDFGSCHGNNWGKTCVEQCAPLQATKTTYKGDDVCQCEGTGPYLTNYTAEMHENWKVNEGHAYSDPRTYTAEIAVFQSTSDYYERWDCGVDISAGKYYWDRPDDSDKIYGDAGEVWKCSWDGTRPGDDWFWKNLQTLDEEDHVDFNAAWCPPGTTSICVNNVYDLENDGIDATSPSKCDGTEDNNHNDVHSPNRCVCAPGVDMYDYKYCPDISNPNDASKMQWAWSYLDGGANHVCDGNALNNPGRCNRMACWGQSAIRTIDVTTTATPIGIDFPDNLAFVYGGTIHLDPDTTPKGVSGGWGNYAFGWSALDWPDITTVGGGGKATITQQDWNRVGDELKRAVLTIFDLAPQGGDWMIKSEVIPLENLTAGKATDNCNPGAAYRCNFQVPHPEDGNIYSATYAYPETFQYKEICENNKGLFYKKDDGTGGTKCGGVISSTCECVSEDKYSRWDCFNNGGSWEWERTKGTHNPQGQIDNHANDNSGGWLEKGNTGCPDAYEWNCYLRETDPRSFNRLWCSSNQPDIYCECYDD